MSNLIILFHMISIFSLATMAEEDETNYVIEMNPSNRADKLATFPHSIKRKRIPSQKKHSLNGI